MIVKLNTRTILKFILLACTVLFLVQVFLPVKVDISSMIIRILLTFIFLFCLYKGLEEPTFINPYFLFSLTPFSLLLYSSSVSEYYLRPLSFETLSLSTLNIFAFIFAFNLVNKKKNGIAVSKTTQIIKNKSNRDLLHSVILFILGILPNLFNLIDRQLPFGHFFSMCLYIALPFAYKSNYKKVFWLYCGFYFILQLLTTFNKTNFLLLVLVVLVIIEPSLSKKNRFKLLLLACFFAFLLIFVAFPLKDYLSSGNNLTGFLNSNVNSLSDYFSPRISWEGNEKLMIPYMYLTTSWNNLQYVIENNHSFTMGLWFFKPLLSYLQVADSMEIYNSLIPFTQAFNTFSFVTYHYIDFGYIGSLIPTLFLGWYVGRAYNNYKFSNNPFNTAIYGLIACAVLEMFFSNHFFTQSYPFTVFIVCVLYKNIIYTRNIKI